MGVDRKELFFLFLIAIFSVVTLIIGIKLDILLLVLLIAFGLVVGAIFLFFLWRRPATLLLIYIILLPINSLALAAIFRYSGSRSLVSMLQPWKELLAVFALFIVFVGILFRLKISSQVHKLDLLIALLFLLNLFYLVLPIGPDLTARAYGFRGSTFFLLMYVLGRLVPLGPRFQKWVVLALIVIGAAGGLLAIFEKLVLPPTWPNDLISYSSYLFEFFDQVPRGHYGLTWTFETADGFRRSSAFFANPLELASSTLVTGVAALFTMFSYRPRTIGRWVSAICWLLIVASLLLSISRASIIAFAIQTVVASLWLGRTKFALLISVIGFFGALATVIIIGPRLTNLIIETITFQNPSSQGHLAQWIEGFRVILENPLGLGLGMSGQIGKRFAVQVGGENQYFINGVQLGILGFVSYVVLQLSAIGYSLRAYRSLRGQAKALAFIAAAGKFGLLFPAFTSNIDNYLFVTFVTWWLVGFSVQQIMLRSSSRPEISATTFPEPI